MLKDRLHSLTVQRQILGSQLGSIETAIPVPRKDMRALNVKSRWTGAWDIKNMYIYRDKLGGEDNFII